MSLNKTAYTSIHAQLNNLNNSGQMLQDVSTEPHNTQQMKNRPGNQTTSLDWYQNKYYLLTSAIARGRHSRQVWLHTRAAEMDSENTLLDED